MTHQSMRSILTVGACIALPATAQDGTREPLNEKPNIVLIYADDIGYGDLSCYGATRVQTPNVDALAANGLQFRNAHAAAATSTPSRYGLFTGEYPWRRNGTGDRVPCVFMENQRVVNLDPNDPISVSYTHNFEGEPTGKDNPELLYKLRPSLNHGHDMSIVNGISRIGYMKGGKSALWEDENIADSITLHAIRFIEKNKEKPFFLYFGTHDIHVPRFPHERFRGQTEMGHRGDAIVQFDWSVGEIVRALKEAGILENTLIIITSDNGPVVDDGYMDEAVEKLMDHKPWGPFRGGKYSTFEAGTRVPFIVHWPGKVRTGISDALVSQIDMLGTMASLTGISEVNSIPEDSQDQLPAWLGIDPDGRDYVIGAASSLTILTRDWKYIEPSNGRPYNRLTHTELGNKQADQLYDMRSDRGEYDNVAEKNKLMVRFLKQLLEEEKSKGTGLDL